MAFLPISVRRSMHDAYSGDVPIGLLTITHPDMAETIRISSDPTQLLSESPLRFGTVSRGFEFEFLFMTMETPDDQIGRPPSLDVKVDNVAANLVAAARSVLTPAYAVYECVMASAPDEPFQTFKRLRVTHFQGDATSLSFTLSREPFSREPFGRRFVKPEWPGLHSSLATY